mmetsp:Transcript_47811/g.107591  ORF Transcript_47811/g.107591 Transcript_47811/m.107591 type:complete len:379 (+) Transcript_47811:120-1256(+)
MAAADEVHVPLAEAAEEGLEDLEDPEEKLVSHRGLRSKEVEKRVPEPLDEDAYGLGIVSLIRDTELLVSGSEFMRVRLSRFMMSMTIMLLVVAIQMFLLFEVKMFVTAPAVHAARNTYDKYEFHMYGSSEKHTFLTVNGKHRGLKEYFDPTLFDTLDPDLKEVACNIPLSQPRYFGTILLIWTLTCVADISRSLNQAQRLLLATPTIASMRDSTAVYEEDEHQLVVVGLTGPLKAFIGIIFFVRLLMTVVLLWLGCRWLTATASFADILLNAVALEFILLLKELLYNSMVPMRSRRETANTLIRPNHWKQAPSCSLLVGSFVWGLIAVVWVLVYVYHLQRVLPNYNWDVAGVCADWLRHVTSDGEEDDAASHGRHHAS